MSKVINKVSNATLTFLDRTLYNKVLNKVYEYIDFQKIRYQIINNTVYLNDIKSSKHFVTPHFQGYNFLLLFIKIDNIKYNLLVFKNLKYKKDQNNDENIKIYKFDTTNIDDSLYECSIFDGKIIASSETKSSFIINDMYMLRGISTQNIPLENKLEQVDEVLNRFIPVESCNLDFKVSRLYSFSEIPELVFNKIKLTNLKINGLMFLPEITGKYYIYTNETEFDEIKNKSSDDITIIKKSSIASQVEFYMKKTLLPDVYELYEDINNTSNLLKEGIAHIPNIKTSHFFRNIFKDKNMVKVSCIRSEKFNKWVPLCDEYLEYSEAIF